MSRSNTIDLVGASVYVDGDYLDRFLPDLLWEVTLRPDSPVHPEFLVDFLWTPIGRKLLQSAAMGTSGSMKKLSMARLRSLQVPAVPRGVQLRWLELRRAIDSVLDTSRDLLTTKRAFKRVLMQELLTGRRRFGGFASRAWPTRKLGDVASINPESLGEATAPTKTIRYIDLGAVNDGAVAIPDKVIQFAEAPSRARRVVRSGDVLFSTVRPYLQGFAMLETAPEGLVCSTGFAVVRSANDIDARFILEVLFSDGVSRQTAARLTGSSYPALNETDVKTILVPWPELDEREKVVRVLSAARAEIRTLERLRASYATLRRGLMQRLLSGDLDLPETLVTGAAAANSNAGGNDDNS